MSKIQRFNYLIFQGSNDFEQLMQIRINENYKANDNILKIGKRELVSIRATEDINDKGDIIQRLTFKVQLLWRLEDANPSSALFGYSVVQLKAIQSADEHRGDLWTPSHQPSKFDSKADWPA